MNSKVFKSVRNLLGVALLVAGCGGAEPIPVNLATATEPCEYGKAFMAEGMRMVMRDGHLTVEPEEGNVTAAWAWLGGGGSTSTTGETMETGCEGCH
jgi:hypothetical protein